MKTTDITLDSIGKVLIRSFWIGAGFLTVAFLLFVACGAELGYALHKELWSGLTRHEYDLIALCALGCVKSLIFTLFLFPYIAIRMVLRGHSKANEGPT